jgi:acetyltransferase-like isoleucine patch superfamily enzyme
LATLDDPRFRENQIEDGVSLNQARFEGKSVVGRRAILVGDVEIGYASTLGRGAVLWGGVIRVGRYSQLAPQVAVYAVNHPYRHLTSYVNQRLLNGMMQQYVIRTEVRIGHDVWIGHGAVILSDLTVGDGAVVGAGAIVTKDVPPYAVAVGNPARVIASRFPPEIVGKLLTLKWWELSPDRLSNLQPLFGVDYSRHPDTFRQLLDQSLSKVSGASVPGSTPAQLSPRCS